MLWILLCAAVVAPLACTPAAAQTPDAATPPGSSYKYSVYAGLGYTSLNQVNLSRHGLFGPKVTFTRDWGKYFALRATGEYEKLSYGGSSSQGGNPGNPSVFSVLAGPEIHADIAGPLSGQFFIEMGLEHTGGEQMDPSTSFAGGFGGGATWRVNDRWAIQATGDRVGASFSYTNNTPQLGNSSHRTWNPRGAIGVVYRF